MGSGKDGCIRWGGDCQRDVAVLGVNVENLIVTNGDSVAWLFSAVRGGNAALRKLLQDFLLVLLLA